jgi:hypothetical protein
VFSTIATCVGPPGVIATDAGFGWHVIVGESVAQPNVTVPLNPGVDVNTIPIASCPPGGTGGYDPPGGGVTEIVIGEFVSESRVDPVTSFNVAEIVVLKSAFDPVEARPAALIVAASVFDEAQVAVAVRSFVLWSEKVPVAVNCCVELIGTVGFAGVTAMDCSVGGFFVNVAVIIVVVAGIVNVHVAFVRFGHTALQFVNVEPAAAAAVSVTCVPAVTLVVHPFAEPLVQLIPAPVTVPVPVPAVCTTNCGAATALTVIVPDVPAIEAVIVSVTVIVCPPIVFSVAENVPTPFVSPTSLDGSTAAPSVLVKFTVPAYPVAVAFDAVKAVTVKLNAVPAVAAPGAETEKCVAAVDPLTMTVESEAFAGAEPPPVTAAVFT